MAFLCLCLLLYVSSNFPFYDCETPVLISSSCMIIASYPGSYMNLWLKAEHYSVSRVNTYPTGINAVTALASWLGTTLASIYPSWAIYSISMGSAIFSCICMTIWRIPTGLKFFAWYLLGLTGCASPILYSTVNTIIKNDAEERALVIVSILLRTSWGFTYLYYRDQ